MRILDQGHGTDATVRVLIQTTDGLRAWTTVGVGQNIVEASWEALSDAYLYGLIHADDAVTRRARPPAGQPRGLTRTSENQLRITPGRGTGAAARRRSPRSVAADEASGVSTSRSLSASWPCRLRRTVPFGR